MIQIRRLSAGASSSSLALILLAGGALLVGHATAGLRAEDAGILMAPAKLYAGGESALTVTTLDAATRLPAPRPLAVTLNSGGGEHLATLFSGGTGQTGHIRVQFDVPDLPGGSYKIRAEIAGVGEALEVSTTIVRAPGILIETDKPIYKPSQRIQGRVILLDNGLRPQAGPVEVTFHDAKGIRIDRRRLEANEFGVAVFSLDLAKEVNFGTWKIRAKSGDGDSAKDIRVEAYTLPRFDLKTTLSKSWALVDEQITGSVEARYFFGKDVEGEASVCAKRWVGTWEEYARVTGTLAAGKLEFTIPAVGFVSGTPGETGQGSVTLEVAVTDTTGHKQERTEVVTITKAPVVLNLVARAKAFKPEIPAEILVSTKAPDGAPMDVEVATTTRFYSEMAQLLGEFKEVVPTSAGVGILTLLAPKDTSYAEVAATATLWDHTTDAYLQMGGAYSPSGSFLSLLRLGGDGPASVGEIVSFSVASTHSGTVYYEVYAGGRTVLSDVSETETFAFTVTPAMLPRAKVVAYMINPDNEVAADSASFGVELAVSVAMEASFGAEKAKPGDPVRVTIDAGTGRRTLLGVSVVDKSLLALGESRLHLADVFAELERRFLEPQAEVHEGADPGVPDGPVDRMEMPRTRGALDVLKEAGLVVAASKMLTIPEGAELDFWRWAAEDGNGGPQPPMAGGDTGPSAPPTRVRQYFPETWVWDPLLLSDELGRVTLELTTPDTITGWKLMVVGTAPGGGAGNGSADGGIAFGEDELTVFQDFFVSPSLPYAVVRGEVFPVKVDLFNYLDHEQSVALELAEAEGFEITGEKRLSVTLPPDSASAVHFPIRPTKIGEFPVQLTATGSSLSDAVLQKITVVPEGAPAEDVANGVIEAGSRVPLDVSMPAVAVSGSQRAYLNIAPSPVAQTMNGVSDLLGMPYGCGEQNMIFTAPDIEILKYLKETGEISPEIRAEAEYYVNVGYQRELTFMTADGGFAAFGGEQGSLWLTAFVLSTFAGAREVRDIDEAVLASAAGMLVSRQNEDGSFRTDDFLIHKEMDGGLENIYAMAAYVTNALADYVNLMPEGSSPSEAVLAALQKAAGFLSTSRTTLPGVNDDAYSLAIAAVSLQKVNGYAAAGEGIVDRLLALAKHDGIGIHWEPYPVETTGYAAMALLSSNGGVGRPEASSAVEWLSAQRNALGGYGESTQDTVVAIRALFLAARKVHLDLDVELSVVSGDETLFSLHVDASNYDLFHQFELPVPSESAPEPSPTAELVSSGKGNVGFQVVKRYNVPGDLLPPPHDMLIDVVYDASHIEVDDKVDVKVTLKYTGFKEKTGMVIADVGVPTGFAAVQSTLDDLVAARTVSRVELAGRKVIFYIDELRRDVPLEFTFQVLALYPVKAEGPVSHVYEYYDPAVEAYDGAAGLVIHDKGGDAQFLRGDSNDDGAANLSDAVATLNHLFLGGAAPRCMDAADADDSGGVNITDPIFLLQYLFLGGRAPSPPFPEAGTDPTEDGLGC